MIDTGKLRAVIAKATPGPWFLKDGELRQSEPGIYAPDGDDDPWNVAIAFSDIDGTEDRANAAYIATFDPPTTTALLDTIDTLRQQLAEARGALGSARDAIASLGEYDLGGCEIPDPVTGEAMGSYGIRDELLSDIDRALASEASHD